MPSRSFVACAKVDCKWNKDGQCEKSEVFIDDTVSCASYEPVMASMGMPGMGPPGLGADPRAALLAQMASPGPPPPGPSPMMGGVPAPPIPNQI